MLVREAKLILENTIVMKNKNPNQLGVVRRQGPGCFLVDWADGKGGVWVDYKDARNIFIFQPGVTK